jgi:hydroxymethylbilane synthase
MNDLPDVLRIGTRGSALARWQTEHVAACLQAARPGLRVEIEIFSTRGDQVLDTPLPQLGGKGVFTEELEVALREGRIDLAAHSLKDLPTDDAPGLCVGAVLPRAQAGDVLVSRSGWPLAQLRPGATIGTSSTRRAAQLLYRYPHLRIRDIRGNVDTRLRKSFDPAGPYDGVLFARAGLERLDLLGNVAQELPFDLMLPAPGQGAIAAQCRDETGIRELVAAIDHEATRTAVTAERAFLAALGGGCSAPVAAYAEVQEGVVRMAGRVTAPDGHLQVDVSGEGPADEPAALGRRLAADALDKGARNILVEVRR